MDLVNAAHILEIGSGAFDVDRVEVRGTVSPSPGAAPRVSYLCDTRRLLSPLA